MSRRRYVSTKISTDRLVNQLALQHGDYAALLYTWMIPHAEDDGSLPNDAGELMAIVAPWRHDKTPEDTECALAAMAELGLIWRYPDEGILRFPPATFYKYQAYISIERRWDGPAPDPAQVGAYQRRLAQNPASVSVSLSVSASAREKYTPPGGRQCAAEPALNDTAPAENCDEMRGARATKPGSGGSLAAPAEKRMKRGARDCGPGSGGSEAEFAAWWAEYPRRINRAAAQKAYRARRRAGMTAEELVAANRHHAAYHAERGTEAEYIPHGSTFLNGRVQEWLRGPPEGAVATRSVRRPRAFSSLEPLIDGEEDAP